MKAPPVAYRAHRPEWAMSPVSGEGARLHGGRFNRPGVAALYLGLKFETALLEANQGFDNKLEPTTIVQYDIDCEDIVDLTQASERRRWDAPPRVLQCGWLELSHKGKPVPSWDLADRLIKAGIAGILVQSFAPGAKAKDVNLVLWKWGPRLPHKVVAVEPNKRLEAVERKMQ